MITENFLIIKKSLWNQ